MNVLMQILYKTSKINSSSAICSVWCNRLRYEHTVHLSFIESEERKYYYILHKIYEKMSDVLNFCLLITKHYIYKQRLFEKTRSLQ